MTFLKANKISYLNIEKDFGFYSFLFVIISLFTGPLLPEIGIILVIIYFFFNLKKINLKKNEKIVFFIFFGFYISINISNLFIKEEILQSYKVSFFYVRFFVYIILIKYLYNFNFFKFNKTLIFVATLFLLFLTQFFSFTLEAIFLAWKNKASRYLVYLEMNKYLEAI